MFDLDGTLTDPREGICKCIAHALTCMGLDAPHLVNLEQYIGPPLRETFTELLNNEDSELVKKAIIHYRERFSTIGLFENKLLPNATELLSFCKNESLNIFLVTSKPQIYAERILEHFDLSKFFNAVYGPELDGRFNNKSDLIAHLLSQENINTHSSIMVGDRAQDVIAAIKNQITPIGLTCGFGSYQELTNSGAKIICTDLRELKELLESSLH